MAAWTLFATLSSPAQACCFIKNNGLAPPSFFPFPLSLTGHTVHMPRCRLIQLARAVHGCGAAVLRLTTCLGIPAKQTMGAVAECTFPSIRSACISLTSPASASHLRLQCTALSLVQVYNHVHLIDLNPSRDDVFDRPIALCSFAFAFLPDYLTYTWYGCILCRAFVFAALPALLVAFTARRYFKATLFLAGFGSLTYFFYVRRNPANDPRTAECAFIFLFLPFRSMFFFGIFFSSSFLLPNLKRTRHVSAGSHAVVAAISC